ncbi:MAG: VTT domain-containing protein [Bacteriovoracaceae bacterium]|nr:VTT domain-containing protein [Bacteriovoracaceae bacterium]
MIDIFLHLDVHLNLILGALGPYAMYGLLFAIIFCETGLIITPFLPGDSLLFALGALCMSEGSPLSLWILMVTLILAAILGDATNFWVGKKLGNQILSKKRFWINEDHISKTKQFFQLHGGKTIFLARFLPIFRTYAPFVAGVSFMNETKFRYYNALGGITWVSSFLGLGAFFGNIPVIKERFHYVVLGIIAVSFIPVVAGFILNRRKNSSSN